MAGIRSTKGANPKYLFGTPEEVAWRGNSGDSGTESSPPSFEQVKPSNSGSDAANPSGSRKMNGTGSY